MKKIVISNKIKGSLLAIATALFLTGAFAATKYRTGEANDSAFATIFCLAVAVFCGYKSHEEFKKYR